MDWYYRLNTPDGATHLYPLPPAETMPEFEQRARIIAALNTRHHVPDDWFETGAGWDVAVLTGELHPTLLEQATLHDPGEVPAGDQGATTEESR